MKQITALLIFIALSTGTFAQEGMWLGIKGTPQSTWMFNADEADHPEFLYQPTIRASFGLTFGFNFSDRAGLAMDVLWSDQGQRYEFSGSEYSTRLRYLKIPFMLNINSNPDRMGFVFLNVGPQFGFLLSADADDIFADGDIDPDDGDFGIFNENADIDDAYRTFNFGAMFALGVGFNITEFLQFTTALRGDFAFTDAEDKEFFVNDRANTYNATLGLEFGLRFVLRAEEHDVYE